MQLLFLLFLVIIVHICYIPQFLYKSDDLLFQQGFRAFCCRHVCCQNRFVGSNMLMSKCIVWFITQLFPSGVLEIFSGLDVLQIPVYLSKIRDLLSSLCRLSSTTQCQLSLHTAHRDALKGNISLKFILPCSMTTVHFYTTSAWFPTTFIFSNVGSLLNFLSN